MKKEGEKIVGGGVQLHIVDNHDLMVVFKKKLERFKLYNLMRSTMVNL